MCLTLLRCSEESRHVFFSQAECRRQGRPRRVESIQAGDARIVGTREGFLGLDDFDRVGDSRAETVARLRQLTRNYMFFGAPVGLFFCIDRNMGSPNGRISACTCRA